MGLLATVFIRTDGQEIYAPNFILVNKFIYNIRRSPNMGEVILTLYHSLPIASQPYSAEIHVAFLTPTENIMELRSRLREWLQTESREFVPNLDINVLQIDDTNKITLNMFIEHKGNWQEGGKRWTRRTKFMFALKDIITDLGICYYPPIQKVQYLGDGDVLPGNQGTLSGDTPQTFATGMIPTTL
ncbi:hypothetical protein BC936DRAFT_145383 [Jimgerdemannia flammicorona]|uniref:Mechanosensitive ion channel-domain-containing protein n=1 Tax=Jimgerdemannia flammicorona TaxID=994334 RepID=A0A433DA57_9FUNG|nr:hypothetical protein BC936DRAFT_145383 [Jimgerdemannia flammicorona]